MLEISRIMKENPISALISSRFVRRIFSPSSIPFLFAFFVSFFLFSKANAFDLTVTQTPGGPGKEYTLSWTAVTPSTDTSKITYCAYSEFGADAVDISTDNLRNCVVDLLTMKIESDVGTERFIIISSDSADGSQNFSNSIVHNFIHIDQTNSANTVLISRTDGDGSQRGVNQIWKFSWKMDDDAYITAKVYPPGTTFNFDSNRFVTGPIGNVQPIKVLVSSTPRSGELADGSIFASNNDDVWDSRSSTGSIVPNGIYYFVLTAELDAGQYDFATSPVRSSIVWTVPVDILRIINLQTTGITLNNTSSQISYLLTGDATVRVLIARPGSHFYVDGSGDIQPSSDGTTTDNTLLVSSFSFQRQAGTVIESWNGKTSTGVAVGSGIYAVGISARDEFGNHAIGNSGDGGPIFATISVEQTVGSTDGDDPVSDETAPTLTSISPANGASVNNSVSTVTIVLADAGSNLLLSGTGITITNPNSVTVPYTRSDNTATNTITLILNSPQTLSGTYSIAITALDSNGNDASFSRSFSIDIRLDSAAFENALKIFPNPAKQSDVTVQYDMPVAGVVEIEFYNAVGERVFSANYAESAGTGKQYIWEAENGSGSKVGSGLYLVRVKASGGGNDVKVVKKLVVIR
jgi:flagellar hook assembly protein FlgD/methionine-rich copper-binding protein CopC